MVTLSSYLKSMILLYLVLLTKCANNVYVLITHIIVGRKDHTWYNFNDLFEIQAQHLKVFGLGLRLSGTLRNVSKSQFGTSPEILTSEAHTVQ